MNQKFKEEVDLGLNSKPKYLSSKYFYDEIGDGLFRDIMNLPEYYLTRAEYEIFQNQNREIINALSLDPEIRFELIELGAGDGLKTKELFKGLLSGKYKFDYIPIDISQNALDLLEKSLQEEMPEVSVYPRQGEYFDVLSALKESKRKKVILFLGSNMGNMLDEQSHDFIYQLGSNLKPGDILFLGLDLIKSQEIVLPAYNDSAGVTRKFNLNLLNRINKELGANFDLNNFEHIPEYSEEEGIAKSFICSKQDQTVAIQALDQTIYFEKGERIFVEISRKYNDDILNSILLETDFAIVQKFTDSKNYFADYVIQRS